MRLAHAGRSALFQKFLMGHSAADTGSMIKIEAMSACCSIKWHPSSRDSDGSLDHRTPHVRWRPNSPGSLAMCAAIRRVMHESIGTLIFFDACSYVGAIQFRPLLL